MSTINKAKKLHHEKHKRKILALNKKVNKYSNKIQEFNPVNGNAIDVDSHSWFDITKTNYGSLFDNLKMSEFDKLDNDNYYVQIYKLKLNDKQKTILCRWTDSYIDMYNDTTYFIRKYKKEQTKVPNLTEMKKILSINKKQIRNKSKIPNGKKSTYINMHILDYALNDAINAYHSCLTNLKNGNIKYFRLRPIKKSKKNKIIKLERLLFTKNSFCISAMGTVETFPKINNFLEHIKTTAIIKKVNDSFNLHVKYIKTQNKENKNTCQIGIDPGIRTILTGISNNHVLEVGKDVQPMVIKKIKNMDRINKLEISDKRKNHIIKKKRKKLHNKIEDFQWRAANYLTNNYKEILFGNASTKSMVEGKLQKMQKRVASTIALYRLRQKIKYLSFYKGNKYMLVDEYGTTKCCSFCTYYNKKIGSSKIYNCPKCKRTIDRDVNSAKNILMIGAK